MCGCGVVTCLKFYICVCVFTIEIKEKDQAVVSECFEFLKDQDSDDEEDEWEVRDTDTKVSNG